MLQCLQADKTDRKLKRFRLRCGNRVHASLNCFIDGCMYWTNHEWKARIPRTAINCRWTTFAMVDSWEIFFVWTCHKIERKYWHGHIEMALSKSRVALHASPLPFLVVSPKPCSYPPALASLDAEHSARPASMDSEQLHSASPAWMDTEQFIRVHVLHADRQAGTPMQAALKRHSYPPYSKR